MLRSFALAWLVASVLLLPGRGVEAAPGLLTPVTGFGSNPGNLLMYEWIPPDLPLDAPVVVVLHGCFVGAAVYDDETGWTMLAERWKVALVFPEQSSLNEPTRCFGFWKPEDNTRGSGEAESIAQMVDWMHANRGTDPERVFIMGHSGGGLFTAVMLATYPDVFEAGAIVAGGPYGCGDEGALVVGPDGVVRGGECVDGSVDETPQEWGDRARSGFPGYAGPKPRVSIWHGTADTMVSPGNRTELVEQWTDYHDIDPIPETTDTVRGYPHDVFEDAAGVALVESYELTGHGHGWPYAPGAAEDQCNGVLPSEEADICAAYYAGRWFGLPEPAFGGLLAGAALIAALRRRSSWRLRASQ